MRFCMLGEDRGVIFKSWMEPEIVNSCQLSGSGWSCALRFLFTCVWCVHGVLCQASYSVHQASAACRGSKMLAVELDRKDCHGLNEQTPELVANATQWLSLLQRELLSALLTIQGRIRMKQSLAVKHIRKWLRLRIPRRMLQTAAYK